MKRCVFFLVVGAIALSANLMTSSELAARPEYKARLDEMTKTSKAAGAIKEAACMTCHYGTVKKNRNDFGQALNKHFSADFWKEKKADKEEFNKKVDAALKTVLKEKSPQGKSFGELIDSGSLPAINPAK